MEGEGEWVDCNNTVWNRYFRPKQSLSHFDWMVVLNDGVCLWSREVSALLAHSWVSQNRQHLHLWKMMTPLCEHASSDISQHQKRLEIAWPP